MQLLIGDRGLGRENRSYPNKPANREEYLIKPA
jgi:hypothetical protein